MSRLLKYSFLFIIAILAATMSCGQSKVHSGQVAESSIFSKTGSEALDLPLPPVNDDHNEIDPVTFPILSGETTLTARFDAGKQITILNYPLEWRGKIKLLNYVGITESPHQLFSEKYCKNVEFLARHGQSLLVRGPFNSLIAFELPSFLTSDFKSEVLKSAHDAGFPSTSLDIANRPLLFFAGTIELKLKDGAISPLLGNISDLTQKIDLSRNGQENGHYRELFVDAGDLLCDFALGKAEMIMTFPLENDDRVIKVIYDSMEVN